MLAKRTGIKEEIIWTDLKKARIPDIPAVHNVVSLEPEKEEKVQNVSKRERIEERLTEVRLWLKELSESDQEGRVLKKEESELVNNLLELDLRDGLTRLSFELSRAEASKDEELVKSIASEIQKTHAKMRSLEEKKKVL